MNRRRKERREGRKKERRRKEGRKRLMRSLECFLHFLLFLLPPPLDVRNPCPQSERVQVVGKHGAFRSKIDFPLEGLSSARYCALKPLPLLALLSRLLEVGRRRRTRPLPEEEVLRPRETQRLSICHLIIIGKVIAEMKFFTTATNISLSPRTIPSPRKCKMGKLSHRGNNLRRF